jgi:hypothetical protein
VDPLAWASLASPVGCVIFLFIALAKGWLWSARSVDQLVVVWEARLEEAHNRELIWQKSAETWQKTAEVTEETRRDVADQLRTRQIVDEAVVKAIEAHPRPRAGEGA